ncbi:MAG: DUF721 domain-containing protein [Desulfobacter sp.]|nr:MAG: DUF721 domain-containing protein [Desulfobacter sp.]
MSNKYRKEMRYHLGRDLRKESTLAPRSVGDILNRLLPKMRPKQNQAMDQIWSCWKDAVGPFIADSAKPQAYKDGVLIVRVASSSHMMQFRFLEAEMIKNLNAILDSVQIRKINMKVGRVD